MTQPVFSDRLPFIRSSNGRYKILTLDQEGQPRDQYTRSVPVWFGVYLRSGDEWRLEDVFDELSKARNAARRYTAERAKQ